jgi:hypothetical protein
MVWFPFTATLSYTCSKEHKSVFADVNTTVSNRQWRPQQQADRCHVLRVISVNSATDCL